MKKLFLIIAVILTTGCDTTQDWIVPETNVIWIDTTTDPVLVYFADLEDPNRGWMEITDGDVPGFHLNVQNKSMDNQLVKIQSERPVARVYYKTTLMGGGHRDELPVDENNVFSAKVDSVGVFTVEFKID